MAGILTDVADSGLRSFASVQSALSMYAIYAWGSEEQTALPAWNGSRQADRMFRPDRARPWLGPRGHGDAGPKSRHGWILNGTKRWITRGSIADVAIMWAKIDQGITGFSVDMDTAGFTTRYPRQVLDARFDHLGTAPRWSRG
jgi:glutaryl-CoA dehydrogenase